MAEAAPEEVVKQTLMNLHIQENVPKELCEKLIKRCIDEGFSEQQVNYMALNLLKSYEYSKIVPSEAVGVIAAQSIGEPGTQMSIPGDEKVIVKKGNTVHVVKIGEFIDDMLADSGECSSMNESEVLDIDGNEYQVPCLGKDEKMHWGRLRQVSRHPPNGDLIRIKTRTGRTITATPSHSFIVRQGNDIVPIAGKSLKLGDRIPLVKNFPSSTRICNIKVEHYIPKNEAWFGSELSKARASWERLGRNWKQEYNVTYTVPVKEDGLRVAFKTGKTDVIAEGFVYPVAFSNTNIKIPEVLSLDASLGWFLGAYIAGGSNAGTFVSITNSDKEYQKCVIEFSKKHGISYTIKEEEGEFGPSTTINLSSSLLGKLVERMCGKGAGNKKLPSWALNAPDVFVSNLLQAYFDGNGIFSVESMQIRASSNSKELQDGICLLLARFGIHATKYTEKELFNLRIPGKYSGRFMESIGSIIDSKKAVLIEMAGLDSKRNVSYDVIDMIPGFGNLLNDARIKLKMDSKSSLAAAIRKHTKKQEIGRQTLERYVDILELESEKTGVDVSSELNLLKRALDGDAVWDQIIAIELVKSPTSFVYDFSVEEHENFTTAGGLLTHNTLRTFHYAGVREFSVTQGLPRLIELVDARRNPKTPVMHVMLEPQYSDTEDNARKIHKKIEETRVEKIASEVDIDLSEEVIVIRLDPEMVEDKGIDIEETVEKLKKLKKLKITHDENEGEIIVETNLDEIPIQQLQKLREKIKTKIVQGIKGIKRAIIHKNGDEFSISTEGTNLEKVMLLKGVDNTRTYCNDLHETMENLGIEAARNLLIREAKKVLEDQSLDVDIRHLMLTADVMTRMGDISQIGRHGISGAKESVLARAAFEVTIKQLIDASIIGEADELKGIPENVIVGQLCPVGTGDIQLYYDWNKNKN